MLLGCNRVEREDEDAPVRIVHEPELPDHRDYRWLISDLLTGALPITGARSYDLRNHVEQRRMQKSSSCVGHAVRRSAMVCSSAAKGSPIASPSALLPYTLARRLGEKDLPRKPGDPLLSDWGCGVRWALKGIRDAGLCAEELWPEAPENINAIPDLSALKDAEGAIVKSFHRISEGNDSTSTEVRTAGERGYAPIVCLVVDQKFAEIGTGVWDGPGGAVLGGHAMTVVAYSDALDAFLLDNWWGQDFGDDGYAWVSARAINRFAYDLWVVEGAPEAMR